MRQSAGTFRFALVSKAKIRGIVFEHLYGQMADFNLRLFGWAKIVGVLTLLWAFGAVPAWAIDHKCQDLLLTDKLTVTTQNTSTGWKRAFRIGRPKDTVAELGDISIRTQCRDTCYIYAGLTALETTLKAEKIMQPKDELINFIPLMKVAWLRFQKNPESDLQAIVGGGLAEAVELATKGSTSFLEEESLQKIGGQAALQRIEKELFVNLFTNGWRDKNKNLRELLQQDYPTFLISVRQLLAQKLSQAARTEIQLKDLEISNLTMTFVNERTVKGDGDYFKQKVAEGFEAKRYYAWTGAAQDFEFGYGDMDKIVRYDAELELGLPITENPDRAVVSATRRLGNFSDVVQMVLSSLSKGRAPSVGIHTYFGKAEDGSGHAIAIVGATLDSQTGAVKGFKYWNSGPGLNATGSFGYISLEDFKTYFRSVTVIRSLQVGKK